MPASEQILIDISLLNFTPNFRITDELWNITSALYLYPTTGRATVTRTIGTSPSSDVRRNMRPLRHIVQSLISTIFISIVAISNTHSQGLSSLSKHFDTTGLVIRACLGDLPGQKKELGVDYIPMICAYTYNKSKLVTYKVVGFDLVYKNSENSLPEVVSGKGNQFSMEMRRLISTSDTITSRNFFLDNVYLINENKEKILISGLRPFWPDK